MNWTIIIIETAALVLIFTAAIKLIKDTYVIEVSQDRISRMREESGATNR